MVVLTWYIEGLLILRLGLSYSHKDIQKASHGTRTQAWSRKEVVHLASLKRAERDRGDFWLVPQAAIPKYPGMAR